MTVRLGLIATYLLIAVQPMANLIVAERAEARGARIGFLDYARAGVPTTLLTLAWGGLTLILVTR